MSKIGVVFGCMTFGNQVSESDAGLFLKTLDEFQLKHNHQYELDTAYVYTDGKSEEIMGRQLTENQRKQKVATKVNPRVEGGLSAASVKKQFEVSLARLGRTSVDLLYLHSPDKTVPIAETLKACNDLHLEGKFKELGLSNYPSWQVVDIWHICSQHGWVKPTVYQGMYNMLTRSIEKELIPALRAFGIRFYIYNPIAGGLLSGKYSINSQPTEGRFTLAKAGDMYKERYWKQSYFNALEHISKAIAHHNESHPEQNVTILQVAFSWLLHHSQLRDQDAIILGASSIKQLEENLKNFHSPPLPASILTACEEAWRICEADCPAYFRFF